jgi:hypothetical protein
MANPTLESYLKGKHSLKETALYIKDKLVQQGSGAISPAGSCAYRINGKACAIGQIIPDEEYNKNETLFQEIKQGKIDIDDDLVYLVNTSKTINNISVEEYIEYFHKDYTHELKKIDYLSSLQSIHDVAATSQFSKGGKFIEHFQNAVKSSNDKYLKRILK